MEQAVYNRAKERALYILETRDHSYEELFKKLEKNYDDEVCYAVCNKLAELSLIDDARYAKKLADYYFGVKKYGMYRARQEMRRKGISDELIEEVSSDYEDSTVERISELIEKKYARYLTDEKGINKVKAALARMGYSYDDINAAMDEYE